MYTCYIIPLAKNGASFRERRASSGDFDMSVHRTETAQTIQNSAQKTNIRNLYSKIISAQVTERDKATWYFCPPPQRQSKYAFSTTTSSIESNWTVTVSDWFAILIIAVPELFRTSRCQ